MVISAELKPGEDDIAGHHIASFMNFREDTGIKRESIRASSYHHSTILHIQDKR